MTATFAAPLVTAAVSSRALVWDSKRGSFFADASKLGWDVLPTHIEVTSAKTGAKRVFSMSLDCDTGRRFDSKDRSGSGKFSLVIWK